ncbi:MAG: NAD(P)/FAD-dependent oxidoreductase [Bacteroidales bacterium]|nr:NAD(P)/FAD-dependent oxidoreductase [Bacteroidales bacterium]
MQIAIVGAGTSGLFLNRLLSGRKGLHTTLFEQSEKAGTKLRASGGGKANLLNTDIRPEHYNHPEFLRRLLQQADAARVQRLWESFGLLTRSDDEGRVYPLSLCAQTAVDTLLPPGMDTDIRYGCTVRELQAENGKWHLNGEAESFDKVVLCSGSPAGMIPDKRKAYNAYLHSLSLETTPLSPSLVGFRIRRYPKRLNGCRAKAEVRLLQNQREIFRETGEITFKEDGLSGIVILNASAHYNRLENKEGAYLLLDFLYARPEWSLQEHLRLHRDLSGVLHPKLHALYLQQAFDPKNFRLDIEAPYDLAFAQVCHGGIPVEKVDDTLALRGHPGVHIAGELLDIDGVCGGYNLFFACACACVIADNLCKDAH